MLPKEDDLLAKLRFSLPHGGKQRQKCWLHTFKSLFAYDSQSIKRASGPHSYQLGLLLSVNLSGFA